jgi:hypothetical protein
MAASPFAFFRGAAAVMAADLAHEDQTSGLDVQLCGDAHLSNFGGFASPERDLIFDVNDFDETIPGAPSSGTSSAWPPASRSPPVVGSSTTPGVHFIVAQASRSYRRPCRVRPMRDLDIWYSHLDAAAIAARWGAQASRNADRQLPEAGGQGAVQGPPGGTGQADGGGRRKLRFVDNPPLMVPAEVLFTDVYSKQTVGNLYDALSSTAAPCRATASACSRSTSSSTWPARWSGWERGHPVLGGPVHRPGQR